MSVGNDVGADNAVDGAPDAKQHASDTCRKPYPARLVPPIDEEYDADKKQIHETETSRNSKSE